MREIKDLRQYLNDLKIINEEYKRMSKLILDLNEISLKNCKIPDIELFKEIFGENNYTFAIKEIEDNIINAKIIEKGLHKKDTLDNTLKIN